MRKITFTKLRLFCIALVLPLMLFSCKDRFDEHYEVPDWLRGSAWETLEERGNYSIFLEGIELAGYKPIMEGKNILTVMAPDDHAFSSYLQAHGYSSIGDMDQEELKKLIGFHLLYYSYNTEKLINFRPEGDLATEEEKQIFAGRYFKHRTRSQELPEVHTVKIDDTEFRYPVYHQEKYLPVFSYLFFESQNMDAKSNYEYFYPHSTWTGDKGFNVSNASVTNYEILADNGYIYEIDAVLEPLNTIMGELKKKPEYSVFAELYDDFASYSYNASYSSTYGEALGVDSLFLYEHTPLPSIGLEWYTSSYSLFELNAANGYSIFAPTNDMINEVFENFWKGGGYEKIQDVDRVPLYYLIAKHTVNGIVFPGDLISGNVTDVYDNVVEFNPDEVPVDSRIMCSNGTLFGAPSIQLHQYFSSVMAPAFKYQDLLAFMYVLDYSESMQTYGSDVTTYAMFMPDTYTFNQSEYYFHAVNGIRELQFDEGQISSNTSLNILRTHTAQIETPLMPGETRVLNAQNAFNYLYVKNNEVTNNVNFNRQLNPGFTGSPFVPFTEMLNNGDSWINGQAFRYSSSDGIFEAATGSINTLLGSTSDSRYPYYRFVQLLKAAEMIDDGSLTFLSDSPRTIAFIPTTAAIDAALAKDAIPGIQGGMINSEGELECEDVIVEELENYLKLYFISSLNNAFADFPYIGSSFQTGSYTTLNYANIDYLDSGHSISVCREGGIPVQVISDYDLFPFVYGDGCFHFIESIL